MGDQIPDLPVMEFASANTWAAWLEQHHGASVGVWLKIAKRGMTPRKSRSRWSQINRQKAEALKAAGRMRPAGLREVDAAKADGRWEAASSIR